MIIMVSPNSAPQAIVNSIAQFLSWSNILIMKVWFSGLIICHSFLSNPNMKLKIHVLLDSDIRNIISCFTDINWKNCWYDCIIKGAEDELQHAVAFVRPVSVAFEVVNGFRLYKDGVFTSDTCGTTPMVSVSDLKYSMLFGWELNEFLKVPYLLRCKVLVDETPTS